MKGSIDLQTCCNLHCDLLQSSLYDRRPDCSQVYGIAGTNVAPDRNYVAHNSTHAGEMRSLPAAVRCQDQQLAVLRALATLVLQLPGSRFEP